MHHRDRVHQEHDNTVALRFSQERDNAVIGVVKIDPVESPLNASVANGASGYHRELRSTTPVIDQLREFRHNPRKMATKPSALIDTRLIYCGDNLDQLRISVRLCRSHLHRPAI